LLCGGGLGGTAELVSAGIATGALETEQEAALVVEAVGGDLGEAEIEEAFAFGVAGAIDGDAEAGEAAEAAEMGDGALPGGQRGFAVVEDAFWGGEEDLFLAGDFEEEESLGAGHGHPAGLARELLSVVPFFQQEIQELAFPFG